jgi:polar amino acid transport system substrate-binding protein
LEGVHVRKILVAITGLALVFAIASPVGAGGGKQLKVATSLPAPGFWTGDTPDDITGGFEAGIAEELAKRLGYDGYTLKNVSFDGLVAGKAKGFDLALSQVTITDERKEVVGFTTSYFSADQGILVKNGTTVDESNIKTIQWGVQTATTAQTLLDDVVKPDQEPRSYQETTQAFAALDAGQVDAVLLDTSIVSAQANQEGSTTSVVGQFKTGEQYGGIVPKGSKLLKKINKALKAMKADGTLDALRDEFLVPEYAVDPAEVPYLET